MTKKKWSVWGPFNIWNDSQSHHSRESLKHKDRLIYCALDIEHQLLFAIYIYARENRFDILSRKTLRSRYSMSLDDLTAYEVEWEFDDWAILLETLMDHTLSVAVTKELTNDA